MLDLDKTTWQRVTFGDVVKNANAKSTDPADDGIDRVIAMEHLDPGELAIRRWGTLDTGTTFTRRVAPGQTLFGKRRAYQRKVAYAEFDAICSGDILTFEAVSEKLLPELLPFIVQSDPFFERAVGTSAGSLSPRTNWRDLAKFEFDLPPLDEQKRIADLLWAVEKHKNALKSMRSRNAQAINDYCICSYVDAQRRHPESLVEEAGDTMLGRQKAPKYRTGSHSEKYLRVANIGNLEMDLHSLEVMDFQGRERSKYALKDGDILLTEGDIVSPLNVGRAAVYEDGPEYCAFQNTLIRFRPANGDPYYYMAAFEGMRLLGIFAEVASTTTVTHLGKNRFAAMALPIPPVEHQKGYGDKLRQLLNLRRVTSIELDMVDALQASLLSSILGDS